MRGMDAAVTDDERDLEHRIEAATLAMLSAPNATARRGYFERMRALIARRSPEMVARMEAGAGLHQVAAGECDGRR